MALVVEDGTGKPDAESYVSVADANAYALAHGLTFAITGGDLALAEAALRRATTWLDATYRNSFPGRRKNGRAQSLEWPRFDAWDNACPPDLLADDEIPVEIVNACCEAAVREKAKPGSLSPDVTPGKIKKSARVGDIAVEYASAGTVQDQKPVILVIDGILSTLIAVSRSPALFGKTVRA